ncbi:MAG: GIY-YIG nuclease family protein [bacterium]|nr:GIY-YIG nuclease family protein [bacterium]
MATSNMLFWTYVLRSKKDGNMYVGYTKNIKKRLEEHTRGYNFSTKMRLLFIIIYLEACTNQEDAIQRERYLKSTAGRRFLRNRLRGYWSSSFDVA